MSEAQKVGAERERGLCSMGVWLDLTLIPEVPVERQVGKTKAGIRWSRASWGGSRVGQEGKI